MNRDYVLITSAWNEEKYIQRTIDSVINQSILPKQWVIISDGSTDGTDEIVRQASDTYSFIRLIRKEKMENHVGFASKVNALNLGWDSLTEVTYEFIGHLDADISFAPDYYEQILQKFDNDKHLGIAGGFIYEKESKDFRSRSSNTSRSVAGAIQLFRRECYDEIGGLVPISVGGEDWHAEIMARMKGWNVIAFPELKVLHHKSSLSARGIIKEWLRQGLLDYSFGTHPLFEVLKCIRRMKEKPYIFGAFIRIIRFFWAYCRFEKRPVSVELIAYLRKEQLGRICRIFKGHRDL